MSFGKPVDIDTRQIERFQQAVGNYISTRKKPVIDAIRDEMRLWARQATLETPPHKGKGKGRTRSVPSAVLVGPVKRVGDLQAKSVGQKRTAREVNYAVGYLPWFIENGYIKDNTAVGRRIIDLVKTGKVEALNSIFKKRQTGVMGGAQILVAGVDKNQHQKMRNKRGRVRKNAKHGTGTIDHQAVKAYVKKKKDNVGMAKGGWYPALKHFGGTAAKWIATHGKKGSNGDVKDKSADPLNPSVLMRNQSPWAKNPRQANYFINNMFRRRIQKIETKIEQGHLAAIRSKIKRLNKRGIAA